MLHQLCGTNYLFKLSSNIGLKIKKNSFVYFTSDVRRNAPSQCSLCNCEFEGYWESNVNNFIKSHYKSCKEVVGCDTAKCVLQVSKGLKIEDIRFSLEQICKNYISIYRVGFHLILNYSHYHIRIFAVELNDFVYCYICLIFSHNPAGHAYQVVFSFPFYNLKLLYYLFRGFKQDFFQIRFVCSMVVLCKLLLQGMLPSLLEFLFVLIFLGAQASSIDFKTIIIATAFQAMLISNSIQFGEIVLFDIWKTVTISWMPYPLIRLVPCFWQHELHAIEI